MLPRTSSTDTIDTWSSDVSFSSHSDFEDIDLEDIDLECPIETTAAANHNLERNILSSSRKSKGQNQEIRKPDKEKSHSRSLKKILGVLIVGILTVGCLFLLVVHIGAKHQADRTFRLLETVQRQLYSGFAEGEVCAFDDRGPASNIITFANKDAAHEAGYKVLHCGACGACSTWENLRIEWATRNYLAAESARCAKKSLLGGQGAVTSCLEQPPITFQGECAKCWTRAIECTKKNCAFIFLQSQLMDTASDYHVADGSVTSVVCEEAHCELEDGPGSGRMGFAECSGATRRRMNIVSSIERPEWQQCSIVDVDYAELFGECCNSPSEFYEIEPKWQFLDKLGLTFSWGDVYYNDQGFVHAK